MIEAVCHVLFTVFNADWGIAMGRGITMMYYFGCIMMSLFAIAFFFLGTESLLHSVYSKSNFTEPVEIYSKSKVLQTTIVEIVDGEKSKWNSINALELSYLSFLVRFRYLV